MKMKEYLIRMLYVEMLGHDASFGHIQGVKMVSQRKLLEKRVGYLVVSMALTALCKLVSADVIPALMPLVTKQLDHKNANIRKKAVMALHRFHSIDGDVLWPIVDKIRKVLCDKDPCVMGASLGLFQDLALDKPAMFKDLVPSFVSILKQVTEHRLPRDYDYHRMPAPWIQLDLLKVLAILGQADQKASEEMYEILHEVMKRAEIGINVGYAIVYECVKTITSIYPNNSLIEEAATSVSRFITSDNHNLKYLGVNSVAAIVQINPKYAAELQMVVIECLEDPDETLRRKTLDLLYSMTNPHNVVFIVGKLTEYPGNTVDRFLKSELVARINELAEKYSPSTWWYIESINNIFDVAGELVKPEVAHNLLRIISESADDTFESEGEEIDIKTYAVETYVELLEKKVLPDVLMQVIAWVLGEFGGVVVDAHTVIKLLTAAINRTHDNVSTTRGWILASLMKLCAQHGNLEEIRPIISAYQNSQHVDLQQRSHEFIELAKTPSLMHAAMPKNGSAEEFEVDDALPFLDAYVSTALANGAKDYQDPSSRAAEGGAPTTKADVSVVGGLNFAAYERPDNPMMKSNATNPMDLMASMGGATGGAMGTSTPQQAETEQNGGLNLGNKKRVWGKPAAEEKAPEPTEAAVTSPSMVTSTPTIAAAPKAFARAKEPEKPKELTEKEKAAAALFGGGMMGGGPKAAPRRARGARRNPQPAAAAAVPAPVAVAATPAPSAQLDLLG